MKLLMVEDDAATICALEVGLEMYYPSAKTTSTSLGREAIDMMRENGFDIALLDLGLPDIDGLEVLKEIRRFSNVPIIVVSARNTDETKDEARTLGANDYITKPFHFDALANRIEAMTGQAIN